MGKVTGIMMIPIVCEKYGWTYKEFMEQPKWFIDLIKIKEGLDAERQKKELNKIKRR